MNTSLEQQRLDLLVKIRLSRATYKNLLLGDRANVHASNGGNSNLVSTNFPKSLTMQLITHHPLLTLAATSGLIYIYSKSKTAQGHSKLHIPYATQFSNLKNILYRAFRISSHLLKNPDHHHLARWIGRLISLKLSH